MKNNLKPLCIQFLLILVNSLVSAQNESNVVYKQKITRDDVSVGQAIRGSRGTIYLTEDSIIFKARKDVNRKINFRVTYNEIESVKRINPLFFPNRILIRLGNDEKYRLFTYKRRQLIKEIKKHLY